MLKATVPANNFPLGFFKNDLGKKPTLLKAFEKLFNDKKGDWPAIKLRLEIDQLSQKINFKHI